MPDKTIEQQQKKESEKERETKQVNDSLRKYAYFKDESGTVYAWVPRNRFTVENNTVGAGRSVKLASTEFKRLLAYVYYKSTGNLPTRDLIEQLVAIKEAELLIEANLPKYILATRFAFAANGTSEILIDKCNDAGEFWRITKQGVSTEVETHPIFRKRPNQNQLTEVDFTGNFQDIKDFARYFHVQDNDVVLLVGTVGAAILAEVPRIILFIYGVQGSVKSSLTKALAWLLDPVSPPTIRLTNDMAELIQALNGRAVAAFDNVSHITETQSDALCRAVTGEGDTKRELYTDDSDIIRRYMRFIIINGINNVLTKFDAIDRSLPIKLDELPDTKRKSEKKVRDELAKAVPKVRGAIYQSWSIGLGKVNEVEAEHIQDLPRMADFANYAEAFCRACGYRQNEFFNRYKEAISEANKAGLESSLLAEILTEMTGSWSPEKTEADFTPTELWNEIIQYAQTKKIRDRNIDKLLPKDPPRLSRELNKIIVSIKSNGVLLERPSRTDRRLWKVKRLPRLQTTASAEGESEKETQNSGKKTDSNSDSKPFTTDIVADSGKRAEIESTSVPTVNSEASKGFEVTTPKEFHSFLFEFSMNGCSFSIENCDFNSCSLVENSVDLILTDPPYAKESLHLWGELGELAKKVLKPSSFLCAYAGSFTFEEEKNVVAQYLTFRAMKEIKVLGLQNDGWNESNVGIAATKALLIFQKEPITEYVDFEMKAGGIDKRWNPWGQPVSESVEILERFSEEGDLVVDPFVGGGTTVQACIDKRRNCIVFEIEKDTFLTLKERFSLYAK